MPWGPVKRSSAYGDRELNTGEPSGRWAGNVIRKDCRKGETDAKYFASAGVGRGA